MLIRTYDELKKMVTELSYRTSALKRFDLFVQLVETRINTDLDFQGLTVRDILVARTNDRYIPLPDNYKDMRRLDYADGTGKSVLQYLTPAQLKVRMGAGRPSAFTTYNVIEFDIQPDQEYQFEMIYYALIDGLTPENETNYILQRYPDIYLYGVLYHLNLAAQDAEAALMYQETFLDAFERAKKREKKGRYGPSPVARGEDDLL